MTALKIGKHTYELPERWEELRPRQYRRVAPMLASDNQTARAMALLALLPKRLRRRLARDMQAIAQEQGRESNVLWQILDLCAWLFVPAPVTGRAEVQPRIEGFWVRGQRYLLPQANLRDVTIGEWADVQGRLRQYDAQPTEAHMLQVVAALCRQLKPWWQRRRQDWDGYPRIAFNPETVKQRAARVQGVPAHVIHAVFDYLVRADALLRARYGVLFQGEASDGESFGWYGTILNVAELGTFGDEEKVKKILLHRICLYMAKRVLAARKNEKNEL